VLEVRLSTLPTDHPDVQAACNDVAIALADIENPRLPATVSLAVGHASQGARAVPRGGGFLADAGTVDTVIDQFGTTWALARFGG
jgi:hypothetical protein